MPLFRSNGKVIFFAHIPKCGGTTIEYALKAAGVHLSFIDESWWSADATAWCKSSAQHATLSDLRVLLDTSLFDYQFTVIRDPVARFLSAFNHNRRARRIPFYSTLEQFLGKIEKRTDYFGYSMDNHFVPASRFVDSSCEVFRLEDGLERVVRRLADVTDGALEIDPKHHGALPLNDKSGETLLRRVVKTHLMPKIPRSEALQEDTLQRIRKLYAEDFERFY